MTATGDDELALQWSNGDRGAADELTRRHYAPVRRFFDLRLPNLADDLTQQTFAAVLARLATNSDPIAFRPYLFGVARKLLLGHQRKQGRHDKAVRLGEEDSTNATSLSMVAARREEQVLLLMAASTLPTELQIALNLYYWENMTTQEIGLACEVPASTVGSRLARARELLQSAITDLTRPGLVRDRLLADLDGVNRSLGPLTAQANARPTRDP